MEFQQQCLKTHNEYRQKHGVPPLKLSKELCTHAQNHANFLIKRSALSHSNNPNYGENIYAISSNDPNLTITGDEAVRNWYKEVEKHTFGEEPTSLGTGHFTQVVWKDTKELGVAFAKNGGRIIIVANYSPPGNYIGQYAKCVPPIGGFSKEINGNNVEVSDKMKKLTITKKCNNGTEGSFEEDFLEAHNEYRRRHGVKPLKLDKDLCRYSQEWARNLAARNVLEHRKNSSYGENLYCLYSSDPNFTITGKSKRSLIFLKYFFKYYSKYYCKF